MEKHQNKVDSLHIGDTVRMLRLQKGLTCEQLATAVDVSPEAIDHYEDNSWRPGSVVLQRLATVLDVTPIEIVNGFSVIYSEDGEVMVVQNMGGNCFKTVTKCVANNQSPKG